METLKMEKTPFLRLIIAVILGVGTAVAPLVLLLFGLIQFSIIRVSGPEKVTEIYGVISGIASLAIVILSPLGGIIADKTKVKFGRRRFWIVVGSILGALSMLLITFAPNLPLLVVGYIAAQFFYGIVSLSCFALVPEQVEQERFGKISGLMAAAAPAFVMTGQIVMGVFASASVQSKLLVIIAVQLIGGLVCAMMVKDNNLPVSAEKKEKTSFSKGIKSFYPSPRKYPSFTWALLTKLFVNVTNAGLTLLTLFYIARFSMDEAGVFKMNAYTAPSIMLMVLAGIIGGFLSDKIRKQKIFVMASALVTGICLVVFAFSYNLTWVIAANFVFNFGFGMFGAVDNAMVNRILPSKENAAKDISIMNITTQLSSSLVNFVAPAMIAFGANAFGGDGYTFFFLALAIFSVLSALAVIPIPEMPKKAGPDIPVTGPERVELAK